MLFLNLKLVISHSTINGSAANKYWTGGVKYTSQIENLGNMDVGTSEKNANRLIAKWFKGEDLPMPVSKGDTANATSMAASPDYGTLTGTLFVADLEFLLDSLDDFWIKCFLHAVILVWF